MAKHLDLVIVVDVESTCWEGEAPPGQESEIIEIGICPLEVATGRRLEKRSILVRPQRSQVSPFCTQLTTLTPEHVARGVTFAEACSTLRKQYQTRERLWASFGDYDRNQFDRQCKSLGVPYPFGPGHLNVKSLFALVHKLPREIGTTEAVALLGRAFEGTHHRGDDDAWNIAGILADLLGAIESS
jgi:inhibitor of KinA sporulation pathway (predicted exonuclease)